MRITNVNGKNGNEKKLNLGSEMERKERKGRVFIQRLYTPFRSQGAQTWITQFYLQITPCLPFPAMGVCMLNHCLEWDKWVSTNFDQERQWLVRHIYSTVARDRSCDCWLYFTLESTREGSRYTTVDIHCRDGRYQWDGGIREGMGLIQSFLLISSYQLFQLVFITAGVLSKYKLENILIHSQLHLINFQLLTTCCLFS